MAEKIREVSLFETDAGRCPVADYIESIKWRKQRSKIFAMFEAIERIRFLPKSKFKKLQGRNELWQVRVDDSRFLGFFADSRKLVLVHAFDKKSAKTPSVAISVATERRRNYHGERRLL